MQHSASRWMNHDSTALVKINRGKKIQYSTIKCSTVHCNTTLHYTTLHHTTVQYSTLHYTTLHHSTVHYTTVHHTIHYTTLHCTLYLSFKMDFRLLFHGFHYHVRTGGGVAAGREVIGVCHSGVSSFTYFSHFIACDEVD